MNMPNTKVINPYIITDAEFVMFCKLIYEKAGISLPDTKKGLVQGRLTKRLRHFGLSSFREYYDLVHSANNEAEMQMTIDLLTTNETYFYREHKHFDFIKESILKDRKFPGEFKVWSAACSSGEEPYSVAMLLADKLGSIGNWNILATDLNQQMLDTAERGLYPMSVTEKIPSEYLREYCLKGKGQHVNNFMMDRSIKKKIDFQQFNLNRTWKTMALYDLILLRNVMIYFDTNTRKKLVDQIASKLKPRGYLFISHSETLNGISDKFECVHPAIYRLK